MSGAPYDARLPQPRLPEARLPQAQAPAIHHRRFGDVLVTALEDGFIRIPPSVWIGCDEAEGARLSAASFGPPSPLSAINALLVRSAGRTVLVDAGAGSMMGVPTAGHLMQALRLAGVAPDEIDTLVLTHMHVDHLGGAVDAGGNAVFPRAELVFPAAEQAFWLDPAREAAAPEEQKRRYAGPREVVAAYAGRARTMEEAGLPPGLEAVALPGHSPGHTGYMVGTGADRLLVCSDLFHVPALQVRRPEIGMAYDMDPVLATATRRRVLEMAAAERLPIFGMHLDFPGFAFVDRTAEGYALVWSGWAPLL